MSVKTVLVHELFGHGYDELIGWPSGIDYGSMDYSGVMSPNPESESTAVWVENKYRTKAGLPLRRWYTRWPTKAKPGDYTMPGPVTKGGKVFKSAFGPVKGN